MENKHQHTNCNEHQHAKQNALSLAFWLNLFFSIIEFVGGIATNSTAIIADSFHDFMDSVAIGLAILMEKISNKKPTAKFSYGFKRFSLLSALGLSIFLLIGSVTMLIAAYKSFTTPREVHSLGMFGLAILGLAINGFAFLKIKNTGNHHHGHHHSHGGHNHNSQSIMLHLLEDVLGWAAVLVGSVILYFTGWNWIDGVLTIGIALFIGFNAAKNLIGIMKTMLQAVPNNLDFNKLKIELQQIDGVANVHNVHAWSLDGNYNVGSAHVVVSNSSIKNEQNILKIVFDIMKKYNIQQPTIQLETKENCCKIED